MKYMMLIHHDDAALAKANQSELWADYAAFNEALAKAGGSSGCGFSLLRRQPAFAYATARPRLLTAHTQTPRRSLLATSRLMQPLSKRPQPGLNGAQAPRYGTIEVRPIMDMGQ